MIAGPGRERAIPETSVANILMDEHLDLKLHIPWNTPDSHIPLCPEKQNKTTATSSFAMTLPRGGASENQVYVPQDPPASFFVFPRAAVFKLELVLGSPESLNMDR